MKTDIFKLIITEMSLQQWRANSDNSSIYFTELQVMSELHMQNPFK